MSINLYVMNGGAIMGWKNKCKITVMRKEFFPDLAKEYCSDPNVGKCSVFQEGQEFIVDKDKTVATNLRINKEISGRQRYCHVYIERRSGCISGEVI